MPARSAIQSANGSSSAVAHTGRHVGLTVEHEPALVDVAVEVDRQLRHAGDRLADVDEHVRAVGEDEAPGDAEVTIEPAVEEHAAVDLDAELAPPGGRTRRGCGLTRRPGESVCAPTIRTRQGHRAGGPSPGDQGAAAHDVAGGRRGVRPRCPFVELDEPCRVESLRRRAARRATATARRRGGRAAGTSGTGIGHAVHRSTR